MMAAIAVVLASLALGLGVVAVCAAPWLDSFRAANWRRELDKAFSDGWKAGRNDGKRMR